MKQVLVCKGDVRVESVPAPLVVDGSILVEVAYSLISAGTELAGIHRTGESLIKKALSQPDKVKKAIQMARSQGLAKTMATVQTKFGAAEPVGYSCAGTVIDVGAGVDDLKVGDRVACGGAGYANHAEVVLVPRNLVAKIPDSVSLQDACSATVGAIAMQGVRRAEARLGENVAVIGLGLLGQMVVQMLRAAGCHVLGIDIDRERAELAGKLGAEYAIDAAQADPVAQVMNVTGGMGADSTIITAASESNAIVQQAMEMTRKKGKVVVVGAVGLGLQRSPFYEKEIDLLISCSYGPGRYDAEYEEGGSDYPYAYVRWTENRNMQEYLRLIDDGKVDFKTLVDRVYPVDEAAKAYESLGRHEGRRPLAVLLEYKEEGEPHKLVPRVQIQPTTKITGRIGVAVIGAGNFAQAFHLPNLKSLSSKYQILAIADTVGTVAESTAKRYEASYATTDYRQVLADDNVDMVVITTRHNLHAAIAMEAAKSGKAVLCEKPMAMNEKELNELVGVLQETKVPYMVGFNRRFSPAAVRVKKILSGASSGRTPLVVNYRVNTEHLPPGHWVFSKEGGGRIVGEACHMFDLFNYFTGSTVESVDAKGISDPSGQAVRKDSFAAVLKYADGSVCTLIYTSVGADELGKEYIEIHCGSSSFIIDNFKSLALYGVKGEHWKSRAIQKGHLEELIAFEECMRGGGALPIPLEELVSATRTSYLVENSLS
jgi:predicted dehydrogenase